MKLVKFSYNNIKEEHTYHDNVIKKTIQKDFNKFIMTTIANYICPFLTKEEITQEVVDSYKNEFKQEVLNFN